MASGSPPGRSKRVVVLGMDGLDPGLLTRFMDEGRLPQFAAIRETGGFRPLASSNPPQSPVSWASMATGRNPGCHGVFDFLRRDPTSYAIELSITRRKGSGAWGKPRFESPLKAPPFWDVAAEAGVPATVIRWPLTFPAEGKGEILAGLGTPDITGGLGSYILYTTAAIDLEDEKARHTVSLAGEGPYATQIPGPLTAKPRAGDPLSGRSAVPITIIPGSGKVTINAGGRAIVLGENQFSELLSFSFSLGWFRSCRAACRFLLVRARDPLILYLSPVAIDPLDPVFPIGSPPPYAAQLATGIGGRFHTLGMPEDTRAVTEGVLPPEAFLTSCDTIMHEQERMLSQALEHRSDGLLAFVFFTPDRIQHLFWAGLDDAHPFNDVINEGPFSSAAACHRLGAAPIRECYERMDGILGTVRASCENRDTLLVVSDHGFTTFRRSFNLNHFLVERGYMTLSGPEGKELFQSVRWERTQAYALGFSGIYFNRAGRERMGILRSSEVDELAARLTAELLALEDPADNRRPVRRVWRREELYSGPETENAPDLILGLDRGYRFSWQTALGASPYELFTTNDTAWSGTHLVDPDLVPGILLSNRAIRQEQTGVLDVFPTVLSALGVPVPEECEGTDLLKR